MRSQHLKFYFENPLLWDAIRLGKVEKEIAFLNTICKRNNVRSILDVGCGTGLHMGMLSKKGYAVTGADVNINMLKHAQKIYPHLRFIEGDMRSKTFPKKIPEKFDAIICICTVFSYNTSNKEVEQTLKNFHSLLKPNGILILDNINLFPFIENYGFKKNLIEKTPYSKFDLISETRHRLILKEQVLEETRTIRMMDNRKLVKKDTTRFRIFFPQELIYILEHSGFVESVLYSGFSLKKTSDLKNFRLVSVSKKMGSI